MHQPTENGTTPANTDAANLASEEISAAPASQDLPALRISRSKVELFMSCKCCFYLDRKLEVREPPSFPLTLNIAVDDLLKKEFDSYREAQQPHPIFIQNGLDLVPFKHEKIDRWRDALHPGLVHYMEEFGFLVSGGLDDIWVDPQGRLYVADYKATSKRSELSLDGPLGEKYKRQVEVYQWLLRKQGFTVSDTAYFLYCNADKQKPEFSERLEFQTSLLPHVGNTDWIEPALADMHALLRSPTPPPPSDDCKLCQYFVAREQALGHSKQATS
jgi:CRISPR/Cas system-associated exonuclease Cas4 (RecB family)